MFRYDQHRHSGGGMNPTHLFAAEEFEIAQTDRGFAEEPKIDTNVLEIGLSTQPLPLWTFCCTRDASQFTPAQYTMRDYCGSLDDLADTSFVGISSQYVDLQSSEGNSTQSWFPCSRTTSVAIQETASRGVTYSALFDENLHTSSQGSSSRYRRLVNVPPNVNGHPRDSPRPTSQAWRDIRPYFLKLYITDDLPLHVVVECLKRDQNFHATENMYKKRIKDWGISKNMSKHDKEALLKDPARFEQQSISNRRRTLRYAKDSTRASRVEQNEEQVCVQGERLAE